MVQRPVLPGPGLPPVAGPATLCHLQNSQSCEVSRVRAAPKLGADSQQMCARGGVRGISDHSSRKESPGRATRRQRALRGMISFCVSHAYTRVLLGGTRGYSRLGAWHPTPVCDSPLLPFPWQ